MDIFEVDQDEYSAEMKINQLETWDSLKHMEFVVSLEEEFKIKLTGDEIAAMQTFQDVENMLKSKVLVEWF